MNKVYDYQILSALHLILDDYQVNVDKDDLVYNLKNLLEVIESNEIIEESATD
jgi:hypothetical protein